MRDRGEQRSDQFEKFHEVRLPKIPTEQIRFSSASERACAMLLQKHCDWSPHLGATYQIPVGRCLFDFRLGSTLIEWHPVNLRNEFLTPLFRQVSNIVDRLPKHKRNDFIAALESEMSAQYIKRRAQILSAHPLFSTFKLAVCSTPEQIADFVQRHSIKPTEVGSLLADFAGFLRRKP